MWNDPDWTARDQERLNGCVEVVVLVACLGLLACAAALIEGWV